MSVRTSHPHGSPSWVDLASSDIEKSKAFYTALFGWTAEVAAEAEAMGYTQFRHNGHIVAGLGGQPMEGVPPVWNTYVTVDDADKATERASELGGATFMEPFDVMGYGRMAVLADPTGAVFMLWQPGSSIGAELVNEPGAWSWSELMTDDPAAALEFYSGLFGWTAKVDDGGYHELHLDGKGIAGMMAKPDEMAGLPNMWGVYFAVDDCDAACARVTELGGQLLRPPMDIEGVGRFAVVADDIGAAFQVIALAEPS